MTAGSYAKLVPAGMRVSSLTVPVRLSRMVILQQQGKQCEAADTGQVCRSSLSGQQQDERYCLVLV